MELTLMYKEVVIVGVCALLAALLIIYLVHKKKAESFEGGLKAANTARIRNSKLYKSLNTRYRILLSIFMAGMVLASVAALFLAARPYKTDDVVSGVKKRDIILCLDVSYSLYDLNLVLKDLQRKENRTRLEYLPAIVEFEKRAREPEEKLDGIDALFEHYKKELGAYSKVPLTREEFDAVAAFRNRLVHPAKKEKAKDKEKVSLTLSKVDLDFVAGVLRRFGCLRAL